MSTPESKRSPQPADQIVTALIGCGQRGRRFLDHVQFICDPDESRRLSFAEQARIPTAHAVDDLRRILDNPEIDAVVIATPDHWHAPAAILACQAGKHVYVEKPWSHNFRESQLLVKAAQKHWRVVQHGTQQRSTPFTRDAIQMLHEGAIGDVLIAKAWNVQRRPNIGHQKPAELPAGIDYDLWIGPAEYMPFQANRFHYDWHWWYNFGTGDIGNDGAHEIDYARWGLGVDGLPSRIACVGGKFFHDDDQQFPDTAVCMFEYPGNAQFGSRRQLIFEMRLWSTNYPHGADCGAEFIGSEGKMVLSKRGKLLLLGNRNEKIREINDRQPFHMQHLEDFWDAIRNDRRPSAGVDEAHCTVALIHLANIALRTGRSIQFDPVHEVVIGDSEASQFLSRSYRQAGHWAIPQGV